MAPPLSQLNKYRMGGVSGEGVGEAGLLIMKT